MKSEQVLFQSSRPEPAAPPPLVAWLFPIGVAIATAIAGLSAARNRRVRIAGAPKAPPLLAAGLAEVSSALRIATAIDLPLARTMAISFL